jgi:hypothetical protein
MEESLEDMVNRRVVNVKVISELFPKRIDDHVIIPEGIHEVIDTIHISERGILEISPGAVLKFSEGAKIKCNGNIKAIGTSSKPIIFTALNFLWEGIQIEPSDLYTPDYRYHTRDYNYGYAYSSSSINISPVFKNCKIDKVHCGNADTIGIFNTALYIFGIPAIEIDNCTFHNNYTGGFGGAMSLQSVHDIKISNTDINHNVARYDGGGINIVNSNISMKNNKMLFNKSERAGGGIYASHNCRISIEGCEFINNESGYGGGIELCIDGSSSINKSIFTSNHNRYKGHGGAIRLTNGSLILTDNIFRNNTSEGDGGAIYLFPLSENKCNVIENKFMDNSSKGNGGAILVGCSMNLMNNEFIRNTSLYGKGGAVYKDIQSSVHESGNKFFLNLPDDIIQRKDI